MRRREFIAVLGGAVAAPFVARAQQPGRMRLVGHLTGAVETDPFAQARINLFSQKLAELGWIEGKNLRIEKRFAAGSAARIQAYAKELVDLQPDVIHGGTNPIVAALLGETKTIPIVFTIVADPVGAGFLKSLTRPAGNTTGFTLFDHAISNKWLELLKEAAPGIKRVVIMHGMSDFLMANYISPIELAAPRFGVRVNTVAVDGDADIETVVATASREPGAGLIVMPDSMMSSHRWANIAAATRYRVPAIYPLDYWVKDGGLMSYGTNVLDMMPRAAAYVDRILRGEDLRNLPVQHPARYDLSVNRAAAKALNLELPASLLARADNVIE